MIENIVAISIWPTKGNFVAFIINSFIKYMHISLNCFKFCVKNKMSVLGICFLWTALICNNNFTYLQILKQVNIPPGTYQVHIRYISGTYQVYIDHISGTYRVHIGYISETYRVHIRAQLYKKLVNFNYS